MSANPLPDNGFADVAAMLRTNMDKLDGIAEALKAVHYAPLSAAELRVADNVKPSAPCILEEDATLSFMGREISLTLRAYGRWHRAYSGISERGERPTSPPEAAHYAIDSVTISSGPGSLEVEVYNALNDEALELVGDAAYEADPQ